ncbi:MFS general substrate transporter [Acrodontium crateriforme]|uniref:MFS general substrate transporter n=1 Tax=Acrodontium crateriforme TaxID=150365 RepID=A0AAQ3M5W5_9PEZI|nr:MFS general substrate transporter [Acrodontium crateriforme]
MTVTLRQAFALSKDEVRDATPFGTATLIEHEITRTITGHHDIDQAHLQLVPKPSADPADPLNWPMWRKIVVLLLMSVYSFLGNFASSVMSSALPTLITAFADFHDGHGAPTGILTFSTVTHLLSVSLIMQGLSNLWFVPLGNTFGRRPIILISLAILTGSSIWCAKATSFNSLLAARVFQGVGEATSDTLAPDCVGRLFFVHQRGRAMGVYTVFLAMGSLIGGLVGGYITADLGWRWTCWIPAILSGILLVLCTFLLPETMYDRETEDTLHHDHSSYLADEKEGVTRSETVQSQDYPPFTFARSLKMGIYRPGLLRRLVTPFKTLRFPGTIMVMLHYGGLLALIVTISSVAPLLLAEPPWLWGSNVGLINVGGLIGAAIGAVYVHLTSDWWVKYKAKKEVHGYGEPEARLPLLFPGLIMAVAGALVFGFSANGKAPKGWIGMEFGAGMISFGLMQVPSIGFNYLIEAYGDWASDCFLMVIVTRSIISFAWTFFVGSWVESAGAALPFGIFTLFMALFSLTALPVWLYGKRLRIFTEVWVRKEADW